MSARNPKAFYDAEYSGFCYESADVAENHPRRDAVASFIAQFRLEDKRCLEIGCGRGALQDLVRDYVGVDIADTVAPYIHKPFRACSATDLPFGDGEFDAIWSITVLEHVPEPERALEEMRRVLRPNGLLLLGPAWHCPRWLAKGYLVRPYSDFGLAGKFVKASLSVRGARWYRAIGVMARRSASFVRSMVIRGPSRYHYRELEPNWEVFWMSDSDAVASLDQYETVLWFVSRGDECPSHPTWKRAFFNWSPNLVVRVKPDETTLGRKA